MDQSSDSLPKEKKRRGFPVRLAAAIAVVVVLACGLIWFRNRPLNHDQIAGVPVLKADAAQLTSTVITPHLEEPIRAGGNVLWCSTFQLVWNETCKAAGGDVHMQNESPMVGILNKKVATESDVDSSSLLVMAGFVKNGTLPKIRQALSEKFHGQAVPDVLNRLEQAVPSDGWVGYAYLFRELPFEFLFDRFKKPLVFAGGAKVASFGIREDSRVSSRCMHQVAVLDYRSDDDFIVELAPKVPDERIILAKISPEPTLQEAIGRVRERIAAAKGYEYGELTYEESLVVPVLNFDLLREYKELYERPITTTGPLKDLPILLALQSVRFRLDESGAVLKSEAGHVAPSAPLPPSTKPRQLVFDKPFLILLERREAAQPYFALWAGSAELFVPM